MSLDEGVISTSFPNFNVILWTLTCKIGTAKAAPRILAITPYFIEKIM